MRNVTLAQKHQSLSLASDAFARGIVRAMRPRQRSKPRLIHLILAKHAVESELMLLDGVVRTLTRGNPRRSCARARSQSQRR